MDERDDTGDARDETKAAVEELLSVILRREELRWELSRAELLALLVGQPLALGEDQARSLLIEALAHRRQMAAMLGREVSMHAALVDLVDRACDEETPREGAVAAGSQRTAVLPPLLGNLVTDALTGLAARATFLQVLQHALNQRQAAQASVLVLEVVWPRPPEAAARDEVLGMVGRTLPRRLRRSDVVARVGRARFALLLTHCSPDRAAMVSRHLAAEVRMAGAEEGLGVVVGVTEAARGEHAESVLARAEQRLQAGLEASAPGGPTAVASSDPGRLAVYVGLQVSGYLEAQRALAPRGTALLWARDSASAAELVTALQPALVLVDVMAPPNGGQALLEKLLPRNSKVAGVMVAPRRWSATLQKTRGTSFPVLPSPLEESRLEAVLSRVLGAPRPALPPLPTEEAARNLAAVLGTLLVGGEVPMAGLDERPELDIIRLRIAAA
jgi:GGDEF domain-containing protein/CheY-like chemotaxis protein